MDHVKGMTPGLELPNGQAPANYPQKFVKATPAKPNTAGKHCMHAPEGSVMNAVLRAK